MSKLFSRARIHLSILLWVVGILWAVELADQLLFARSLDRFGIRPRMPEGLWGILLAPFLHGSLAHLMANTASLIPLGWLVMLRRTADFFLVGVLAILVGGLGVWLVAAPNTVHVGASGVIFAYLGYLLLLGFFERSFGAILLSLMVGFLYGGALWGLLPTRPGISWQGHLFGFLAGILAARLLIRRP